MATPTPSSPRLFSDPTMTTQPRPDTLPTLADSLARLTAASEHLASDVGPLEGDWVRFSELYQPGSPLLASMLEHEAERCPGLDRKGQVAFLLGGAVHYLTVVLAPLYLLGRQVPLLDPERLAFRTRLVAWRHGDESGTYQTIDWRFLDDTFWTDQNGALPAAGRALDSTALRGHLNRQLQSLFEPLVECLKSLSKLSRGAQWRQAADSLAGAFLTTGQVLNLESEACAEAEALLADPDSAFNNSKTGFVEISVDHPSQPGQPIRRTYRARGGCCRYYTADKGKLCATCVLVKDEERDRRLRNHLLHHHA